MGPVGARSTTALPKILPVIFALSARLPIIFRNINFAHQADMRFRAGRFHALVGVAVHVEGTPRGFHSRRHPLDGADRVGSGLLDGIFAARWHPQRRMGFLYKRYG